MNMKAKSKSNGFGLQRDITADGAVIYLRITSPRRLNVKLLGEVLLRYLQGGYKTLVLDQGVTSRKKMGLLEFLGQLQAAFNESRLLFLERKLIRDPSVR
jgi:hypothetical protein